METPFKKKLFISESNHVGVGLLLKAPGEQVICEFDQTPDMVFHAEYIKDAVNAYPDLLHENEQLKAAVAAIEQNRQQAQRVHEIIADLAFDLGHTWRGMHSADCGAIMDHVGGSRGLMDWVIGCAHEFDALWEAMPADDERREDYISEIDAFGRSKLGLLQEEARK
jgi:hypothetical protein